VTPADTDRTPDLDLVTRLAGGDRQALVALFRRRRVEVYRFALHMTGLEATAEDVTQDVFMTVMAEAGRYDASRGTVISWLLGITRNLVRRRLERDRFVQPLDPSAHDQAQENVADPIQDLTRAERIAMIRRAVLSLPSRYREVVLLCDLQELSYADAACALNCAVGTVRSRLHRGRALLAAKLREIEAAKQPMHLSSTRCLA
jgi:RNA polymerase sigma-70 factor (ECF subfamily)